MTHPALTGHFTANPGHGLAIFTLCANPFTSPCPTLSQNLAPTDISEVTSEAESLLVIKQLT